MQSIISVRGFTPKIDPSCFVAPNAFVIGDVEIGAGSSVWFNVTIRGDVAPIRIGARTNVQDGTVVHGTFNKCGTTLGEGVTIGHSVVLHGTTVGQFSLIGMGSILMDQSEIGEFSIVGAGSLVTEKSVFPPRSLIVGRPAKKIRDLTDSEIAFLSKSAANYELYMSWYQNKES